MDDVPCVSSERSMSSRVRDSRVKENIPIRRRQVKLGRSSDCDVRFHDVRVSRCHAEVSISEDGSTTSIHDKSSKMGTFVNGERIDSVVLKDGDCIELCGRDDRSRGRAVLEYHVLFNQSPSRRRLISNDGDDDKEEFQSSTSRRKKSSDCNVDMTEKSHEEKETRDDEKLLKFILEGAICPICLDIVVFPMVLSCSHTYCEKCITTWMESQKICPECRDPIQAPPVPSLALDRTIDSLMQCHRHTRIAKEWIERKDELKRDVDASCELIDKKIKEAVRNRRKFLDVRCPWKPDERRTFHMAARHHQGKTRRMFCDLIGLTSAFIRDASHEELETASSNLGICMTSSDRDEFIRSSLKMFTLSFTPHSQSQSQS